jgi:drug/metabolite transporter (DMT)-like permease
MTQEAIFWTLITTLLAGIHVSLGKIVAQKKINGSLNSIFTFLFSSIVFGLIFLFFKFPTPPDFQFVLLLALCAGFVYGISFITRIYSLHHIDSVLFFPINKILGPIFAVSAGILIFKEQLTNIQMFGVLLSIFVPVLLINKSEKQRQTNLYLGIILLILSTLFGSIQSIFLKTALNLEANIFYIVTFTQFFAFTSSLLFFYTKIKNII